MHTAKNKVGIQMAELPKDETLFERRHTMKKVKMVLNWCIPVVLIAVALMTPAVAEAKSIKIWPDQLILQEPSSGYYRSIYDVRNGSFNFILNLPSGATITKITYYHRGNSGARTTVDILRVKMGGQPETLWSGESTDSTAEIIPVDLVLTGDPIIRSGYRYYIDVYSPDVSSSIMGVKITYQ